MSEAQLAGGSDRLPWLADETRAPAARRKPRGLKGWAAASVVLVAGLFFWLGTRSPMDSLPAPTNAVSRTTVPMPAVRPAEQPQVQIAPEPQVEAPTVPEVRQSAVREVRIAPPPTTPRRTAAADIAKPVVEPAAKPAPVAKPEPAFLTPWPSRVTTGASGRLVQIGAYGSRLQAKRGWAAMVRAYPAVAHLSAVVVDTRNSHGRTFYRFQIGTTSQAHSEVLCQRMEKIALSCAVVGLPWKARVER